MKQLNQYITEKLKINKNVSNDNYTTYSFSSYDGTAWYIAWLFGRIAAKDNYDDPDDLWPTDPDEMDDLGPITMGIYEWVKDNKVKKFNAILNDVENIKDATFDKTTFNQFDLDKSKVKEILNTIEYNKDIIAENTSYQLLGTEQYLVYLYHENYARIIIKVD